MKIKLTRYHVTDGTKVKARVYYSIGSRLDGRKCITLYAKDYGKTLQYFFANEYQNDTDIMTDYFEKGRVVLFENHPLYAQALERAEQIQNKLRK